MKVVGIHEYGIAISEKEITAEEYLEQLAKEDLTDNWLYLFDLKNNIVLEIHRNSKVFFDYEDPQDGKPIMIL
jgi:hypothetical protein